MINNSIFINLLNGLDIKVEEKKVLGEIHKIKWDDAIRLSSLIRQSLEKLYPNTKFVTCDYLGINNEETATGIQINYFGDEVKYEEISEVVHHVVSAVLSKNQSKTKDLFLNSQVVTETIKDAISPVIQTFIESNPRKNIAVPVSIQTHNQKITVQGQYIKHKQDKRFLENIKITAQIDILGRKSTKFTAVNHTEKTLTIFYDPKDFFELHELQGKNELAEFELQPVQENGRIDYMLKSINRISHGLDALFAR